MLVKVSPGLKTLVWNCYLYKLGAELSSQESKCSLSFQHAGLEIYQAKNAISPTWYRDHSTLVAYSWTERIRRLGNVQTSC